MLPEHSTPDAPTAPVLPRLRMTLPLCLALLAAILWTATAFLTVLHARGEIRGYVFYFVLLLAVMTTLVVLMAYYTQSIQRKIAGEHADIHTAIGQLAALAEQNGEKVDRIDPWAIYTAVAADMLGQDDARRRP